MTKPHYSALGNAPRLLISGQEAIKRRDALESALVNRLPRFLRNPASAILTWITGLVPSTASEPFLRGNEIRAFIVTVACLALGVWFTSFDPGPALLLGALLTIGGMRSFSSVVGHHMTHGAKVLPLSAKGQRYVYDAISAFLWLPDFATYGANHQKHHAYTAGPSDPDQRFIAFVGAHMDSLGRFLGTLFNPMFHLKFLRARLKTVFLSGRLWRRALATIPFAIMTSVPGFYLSWFLFAGLFYQAATLLQWLTEHLWGKRPIGRNAIETARAVTFGRLFLPVPKPGVYGALVLVAQLLAWAAVRAVFLSGDLPNHDLHHIGKGPWTEASNIRTKVILMRQIELRQTAGLHDMFSVAFESAQTVPPLDLNAMDDNQLLGL